MPVKSKTKIYFVGTGGGGSMVATQTLSTAGTFIEIPGLNLYLDPGPGAVLRSRQLGLKLENLDAIFISHRHIDHCSDVLPMVESWFNLDDHQKSPGLKWLFVPKDYLKEYKLPNFIQSKISKRTLLQANYSYKIKDVEIITTSNLIEKPSYKNDMPEVYGMWIKGKNIDIGFLPQTQFKKGLLDGFTPQTLIMDAWSIAPKPWEHQINSINQIKPKQIILRHFTKPMFDYGLDKIAANMAKQVDTPVYIAPEGGKIEI